VRLLVLDLLLLAALAIGVSLGDQRLIAFLVARFGLDADVAGFAIVAAALALALPLAAGFVRVARRLGRTLADSALPAARQDGLDLAAAPRRALDLTLQIAIVLLAGVPLLALTQPFIGGFYGALLLALLLSAIGISFWRGAADLQGHVRAGAQTIIEALVAQARRGGVPNARGATGAGDGLSQVHELLPGLGEPTPVRLEVGSAAVGKTLAALNLRALSGATILAIQRGEQGILVPSAQEVLRAGDVLALAGTHAAIDAAREILAER
jgi:CPA2 family monovalent cation:H+ antiporter-2